MLHYTGVLDCSRMSIGNELQHFSNCRLVVIILALTVQLS
jgi:hypothetical protein